MRFIYPVIGTGNDDRMQCSSSSSSSNSSRANNPTNPEKSDTEQESKAVTLGFDGVDEYVTTFSVIGEHGNSRNFVLARHSALV